MKKFIYKILQRIKQGSVMYPGTREMEERNYLTITGIKNFKDLTLKDKLQLNIKI